MHVLLASSSPTILSSPITIDEFCRLSLEDSVPPPYTYSLLALGALLSPAIASQGIFLQHLSLHANITKAALAFNTYYTSTTTSVFSFSNSYTHFILTNGQTVQPLFSYSCATSVLRNLQICRTRKQRLTLLRLLSPYTSKLSIAHNVATYTNTKRTLGRKDGNLGCWIH